MEATATATVRAKDLGPHADSEFVFRPGLNVLAGDSQTGKSTLLKGLNYLLGGSADGLRVRWGAGDTGSIEGFGMVARIRQRSETPTSETEGRNPKPTGELEVVAFGGLNLLDLIRPSGKDPEVRDATRLEFVCQARGIPADNKLFYSVSPLVKQCVTSKTTSDTTLAGKARGMRRDMLAAALEADREVARLDGEITAHLSASDGVDAEAPSGDRVDVAALLTKAIRHRDALSTQADQAARARRVADESRAAIERARASYTGPTVEQAEAAIVETQSKIETLTAEIRALESRIRDEQTAMAGLKLQASHARDHARNLESWSESVTAGEGAVSVSDDDIRAADAEVARLQKAQRDEAVTGEKRKRRQQAEQIIPLRDAAGAKAKELREVADKLEAVVTDAFNKTNCGLCWKNGRLVITETEHGEMFFDDASHGLRTRIGMRLLVQASGDGRSAVCIVDQEAFEGLPLDWQAEIDRIAQESNVYVVTARNRRGPLEVVHGPVAEVAREPAIPVVA